MFIYTAQYIKEVDSDVYGRCYSLLLDHARFIPSFSFVKETIFDNDMQRLKQLQTLGFIDDPCCQVIFDDDVDQLIASFDDIDKYRISETCIHPFIDNGTESWISPIDYAAYCGSLKIFKYLYSIVEDLTE